MNRRRVVGIVTVAVLVLAGSVVAVALIWRTHMMRVQPTITLEQAGDTAERYVRDSVAQLPGKPTLTPLGAPRSIPCDDPTDGGPSGRVEAQKAYWIRDASGTDSTAYFETLYPGSTTATVKRRCAISVLRTPPMGFEWG